MSVSTIMLYLFVLEPLPLESFASLWLGSSIAIMYCSLVNLTLLPSVLFDECFGNMLLFFEHDNHHDHIDDDNDDDDYSNAPLEEEDFLAEPLLSSNNNDYFTSSIIDDNNGINNHLDAPPLEFFGNSFFYDTSNNDDNYIQTIPSTKSNKNVASFTPTISHQSNNNNNNNNIARDHRSEKRTWHKFCNYCMHCPKIW